MGEVIMDYGEGSKFFDDEGNEDSQEDWLVEQAELRAQEQSWSMTGQEC
jgi:hypothetical protein